MSSPRWRIEALLNQADDRRGAESFERQAQVLALWLIATGEQDARNLARIALRLPPEDPGWQEVAALMEEDDSLPF